MTKEKNAIDGMGELARELSAEIEFLGKAKKDESTGSTLFPDPAALTSIERRVLVKSISSAVEALSYSLKAVAIGWPNAYHLSEAERMLAVEEAYEVTESGEVVSRRAKLQTLRNVRFAFRLLGKAYGTGFVLDVSNAGWQTLQRTVKVRDRLMHPKALNDLTVSDNEIRDAFHAFNWFFANLVMIISKTINELRGRTEALKSRAEALEREIEEIDRATKEIKRRTKELTSKARQKGSPSV